jgi:hypothetical protein
MFSPPRLALFWLAALLAAGAASAQPRPPAPAPAQTPAPSQAAPAAPTFTPSHLAIAREVAVTSGITRSINVVVPQLYERVREQVVTRPELMNDLNQVLEALTPEMELHKQQIINAIAQIFALRMSESELKDVMTFFRSASGRKYVESQPEALDDLVQAMQAWTQDLAEYVMVRVRAEMGKKGHQMQ